MFQAWLERNQEKFGSRQVIIQNIGVEYQNVLQFCPQVKFGYVVFTEAETAERLFRQGGVVVRRASGERIQVWLWRSCTSSKVPFSFVKLLPQVRVKRMDGLPAQFYRSWTWKSASSGKLLVENSKLSKFCRILSFYIRIQVGGFDVCTLSCIGWD